MLKACEELDIRPDVFVGTSSGALVVATYGQGIPLDELLDGYRLPWRRKYATGLRIRGSSFLGGPSARDWKSPGYLFSGLFSLDKLERQLRARLPSNDFRACEKTILITAVDLDGRGRAVFGRGYDETIPISQAAAASCCLPLLFRPYPIGDRYFLDGELVRSAAIDLALQAEADIIIVSSAFRPTTPKPHERSVATRGPLSVLTQAVNISFSEKEQGGLDTTMRAHPNVSFIHIAPDLGTLGYFNRWNARALVLRGYREGLRELAAAKDRGALELEARRTGGGAEDPIERPKRRRRLWRNDKVDRQRPTG